VVRGMVMIWICDGVVEWLVETVMGVDVDEDNGYGYGYRSVINRYDLCLVMGGGDGYGCRL